MLSNIFADNRLFLTGASGFLGTALVCQIITSTQCPSLVLLCRGGRSRLHQIWRNTLPPHVATTLCNDPRINVVDGDICAKNLGLDQATATNIQRTTNVVIHAASSINLKHHISRLAPTIIQGTLNAAEFALGCTSLDKFVYISTAYANSHLHYLNPQVTPQVSERIYPLRNDESSGMDAEAEWAHLQEHGTTPEYETTPFPFAYAYAKHLTERLLIHKFQTDDIHSTETSTTSSTSTTSDDESEYSTLKSTSKLLIVRPSIIGPAETSPAPGWQVATSAPVTGLLAFLILTPATRLTFYSAFPTPNHDAIIDEVPVDIVVNRIILHTAFGTSGIVHANRHISTCHSFGTYVRSVQKLRRLPWNPKVSWDKDAASTKLCKVSKLYQVSGCTFEFEDSKTRHVWSIMGEHTKQSFPLFAVKKYGMTDSSTEPDFSTRDKAFKALSEMYFKRKQWPRWALPIFYAA